MDAKYLAEIKAREQAATSGPWKVNAIHHRTLTDTYAVTYFNGWHDVRLIETSNERLASFIAHARTDIPALIGEVERLTEENADSSEAFVLAREECDRLLRRAEEAESKNATLKKALELMSAELLGPSCEKDGPTYYIHQAQEQEAEK